MKKFLLLLIATSSCALMGMEMDDRRDRSQCNQNDYDCCRELLPYAHKNPFYQPHLTMVEIKTLIYIPQTSPDEASGPNIPLISLAPAHRPPYNPAVGLFLAIRAALSSRTITPTQTIEQEQTTTRPSPPSIFDLCMGRQSTDSEQE